MSNQHAIDQLQKMRNMRSLLPESREAIDEAIRSLNTERIIEDYEQERERKNHMLRVLFNRCFALSLDSPLCAWCGLRKECDEYRRIGKE